ncbi:uncharacterized protein RJT21DRAFT_121246 [Scheffersomyces amazonensis]|uniref:uncharacterized protein n=1 Tax=Scheffersomyces amazonensis TaxID=1078765 RepID=UPI00315D0AE7
MVPPKKMTLQEFFNDESFGGSWVDDDIDMASISVPIERTSHYNDGYSSTNYGGGSRNHDYNPPYIVKLLNLPVTANDAFVEDLFRSRFTTFVKLKIVADPSTNILETGIIKKVAFVELSNSPDLAKVLKWHDLYYKGSRRVVTELADFNDFQHCIQFNNQHANEIHQIQEDYIANRHAQNQPRHMALLDNIDLDPSKYHPTRNNFHRNSSGGGLRDISPRDQNLRPIHAQPPLQPPLHHQNIINHQEPIKHKSNPFGEAKPVDVLSRQQEIEKKLINLNNTTVQTLGPDGEPENVEQTIKKFHEKASPTLRRSSLNSGSRRASIENGKKPYSILKRQSLESSERTTPIPSNTTINPIPTSTSIPIQSPAVPEPKKVIPPTSSSPALNSPYAINGSGKSMAEMLSGQAHDSHSGTGGRNTPTKGHTQKTVVSKPVILKKKVTTTSSPQPKKLDLTIKESEVIKLEEEEKLKAQTEEHIKSESIDQQNPSSESEINKKIVDEVDKTTEVLSAVKIEEPVKKVKEQVVVEEEEERPDFRKHLNELVQKATEAPPKEKRPYKNQSYNSYNKRGGYHNNHSYNNGNGLSINNNNDNGNGNNSANEGDKQSNEYRRYRSQRQPYYPGDKLRSHSPTKNRSRVFNNKSSIETTTKSEDTQAKSSEDSVSAEKVDSNVVKNESVSIAAKSIPRISGKDKIKENKNSVEIISSSTRSENGIESEAKVKSKTKENLGESIREESSASEEKTIYTSSSTPESDSFRGRGRGRGSFRGRGRGSRGNFEGRGGARGGRGRGGTQSGNFNLRYVRSKSIDESKPEAQT